MFPGSLKCPSPAELSAFEYGISQGWINWHAFPFNAEAPSPSTSHQALLIFFNFSLKSMMKAYSVLH